MRLAAAKSILRCRPGRDRNRLRHRDRFRTGHRGSTQWKRGGVAVLPES